jgi:hypothetical protein
MEKEVKMGKEEKDVDMEDPESDSNSLSSEDDDERKDVIMKDVQVKSGTTNETFKICNGTVHSFTMNEFFLMNNKLKKLTRDGINPINVCFVN